LRFSLPDGFVALPRSVKPATLVAAKQPEVKPLLSKEANGKAANQSQTLFRLPLVLTNSNRTLIYASASVTPKMKVTDSGRASENG